MDSTTSNSNAISKKGFSLASKDRKRAVLTNKLLGTLLFTLLLIYQPVIGYKYEDERKAVIDTDWYDTEYNYFSHAFLHADITKVKNQATWEMTMRLLDKAHKQREFIPLEKRAEKYEGVITTKWIKTNEFFVRITFKPKNQTKYKNSSGIEFYVARPNSYIYSRQDYIKVHFRAKNGRPSLPYGIGVLRAAQNIYFQKSYRFMNPVPLECKQIDLTMSILTNKSIS